MQRPTDDDDDDGQATLEGVPNLPLPRSSLPASLIPHLYARPQYPDGLSFSPPPPPPLPSMRSSLSLPPFAPGFSPASPIDPPAATVVRSMGNLSLPAAQQPSRFTNPIYSDPSFHASRAERSILHTPTTHSHLHPRPTPLASLGHPAARWREGEAGPSSLVHPTHHSHLHPTPLGSHPPAPIHHDPYGDRHHQHRRRGSSQPAVPRPLEATVFRGGVSDDESKGHQRLGETSYPDEEPLAGPSSSSRFPDPGPYAAWPQLMHGIPRQPSRPESEGPFPRTSGPMASPSRNWTGSPALFHESQTTTHSPSSISDSSEDAGDDATSASQQGKRRRVSEEEGTKKGKNTRKTAVACNFCRGRKLRCNGGKPSCSNCFARNFTCEYVSVQRRRGPGKAPKGSKSKKGTGGKGSTATISTTTTPATTRTTMEGGTSAGTSAAGGRAQGEGSRSGSDVERGRK